MARCLRGRIARIDKVYKLHALDNAAIMHVEASDDALGDHLDFFDLHARKLPRIFSPVAPDFSG